MDALRDLTPACVMQMLLDHLKAQGCGPVTFAYKLTGVPYDIQTAGEQRSHHVGTVEDIILKSVCIKLWDARTRYKMRWDLLYHRNLDDAFVKAQRMRDEGVTGELCGEHGYIDFDIIYRNRNGAAVKVPAVLNLEPTVELPPHFHNSRRYARRHAPV